MSPNQERDLQLLLIRLDERTQHIKNDIDEIKENMKTTFEEIDKDYVKKIEFDPVRRIVYGVVGVILLAVIGVGISAAVRTTPEQVINQANSGILSNVTPHH